MSRIVFGHACSAAFEPLLAGHVEVVVRLVEEQHVGIGAQQHLEGEPLLLAAREGGQRPLAGLGERLAHGDRAAGVPQHLGVPPAGVAPGRVGAGQRHPGAVAGVDGGGGLGVGEARGGRLQRGRRQVEQHVPHRAALLSPAHQLPHDPEPAVDVDAPAVGRLVAGDEPEERGLAGAVGPHEGDVLAVAHAEAHVPGAAPRRPACGTPPRSRRSPPRSMDATDVTPWAASGFDRPRSAACGCPVRVRYLAATGREVRWPVSAACGCPVRVRYLGTTGRGGYGPGHASRRAAREPGIGHGRRRGRRLDRCGALRAGRGDARGRRRRRREAGRQALAPAGARRCRRRDERVGGRRGSPAAGRSRSSRSTATPRRAVARRGWRPLARSRRSRSWTRSSPGCASSAPPSRPAASAPTWPSSS